MSGTVKEENLTEQQSLRAGGRVINFGPGPAVLPLEVMIRAQEEFLNYAGTGVSILEISHRDKKFVSVVEEAVAVIRSVGKEPASIKEIRQALARA